ncbi:MAG: UDP-glucose 4-epimerase GalE [Crocinitomicaceae bacterium]|nr:UDP-glucose 4-epimerase GalE [Crocinitomicaceae bacterium]
MSSKKEILVTGGAGYIGSHTVVELIEAGYTPIILDDFRNSQKWIIDRIEDLTGNSIQVHEVDCCDEVAVEEVFNLYPNISGVIHFAADKAVGESVQNPLKYYSNNLSSLTVILKAMDNHDIKTLVFSSSCTVYGEPEKIPVTESTPIKEATSPYGDTKIISERIIKAEVDANKSLNAILLRYFNPIGAHPSGKIGELPQGIPNNLVPYITQTAKGIREELTVFGNDYDTVDGTNVRDYIHVVDLAKAHVAALDYANNQNEYSCEAFNIGTGKGSSVLEIVHAFEKVNNLKLNYKIGPRRSGDVVAIYAEVDKAKKALNWSSELDIDTALKDSWNWESNGIHNED